MIFVRRGRSDSSNSDKRLASFLAASSSSLSSLSVLSSFFVGAEGVAVAAGFAAGFAELFLESIISAAAAAAADSAACLVDEAPPR